MSRLLIFNLPREADREAVHALVDGWCTLHHEEAAGSRASIHLHAIPGADREQFAVVHLPGDRRLAWALASHLNGCRRLGRLPLRRPLWSWLPAMAWA